MPQLLLGLDPFRDDLHPKGVRQRDDGFDQGTALTALQHLVDEGAVDFEGVGTEALEVRQRRVTGTKVINV